MTNGYHPPKPSLQTAVKAAVKRLSKPRKHAAQAKPNRPAS